MKNIYIIIFIFFFCILQSCRQPGEIRIQNNIHNVVIQDVRWGEYYISDELLPGEISGKKTITRDMEKLPAGNKITFRMTANNRSVFLQTEQEYLLDEDQELLITLYDDTKVINLNE